MKNQIEELLTRGVDEVIDHKHLEAALNSKKKLRVKLGIDPTSPNIHIGRAVLLWKLRAFQELGHQVVFIVGDFTGQIGDTSDKDAERPMLSEEQVKQNLKTYFKQAFKILDKTKTETHYNSKWLKKLGFIEISRMANLFGLHEFSARELIKRRLDAGKRVSFREMMYPLMQGYDSVAVKADVELGGTDQRFNLLAGRTIQPAYGQESQDILITKLLEGLDGRKMSSSWGNVINITDEPNDMFGKAMSINDSLIVRYLTLATRVTLDEVAQLEKKLKAGENPRTIKIRLAEELVTLYHGRKAADKARIAWESQFTNKEKPTDIPKVKFPKENDLVELLVLLKLASSKSEARRLITQGGVSLDLVVIKDEDYIIPRPVVLPLLIKVGKRKFIELI